MMINSADSYRILVVDDAPDTLELIRRNLSAQGYQVLVAPGVAEAIRILDEMPVDLVITDLKMPKVSGLDLVRHVRENLKDTEVMMITGYPTIESAVTAVKAGSHEYLTKPFTNEELTSAVEDALEVLRLRRNAQNGNEQPPSALPGLIGESRAMIDVYRMIGKAASSNATVLISGESGTGKELAARAIHYSSLRASAPFVPVNCGSIPENLLESELFGHVKGAFTGAFESRAGFFQTGDGGTVFLDEISNTSMTMQAKLLRVLQDGQIYMVGSARPREVDVRVLAATNKDLQTLVKREVFREDLYFRLNVINIFMPPLRERGDDTVILTSHFAARFAEEVGRSVPRFTGEALQALKSYHWPGNVRELENLIHRTLVMTDGDEIDLPDLPPTMRFSAGRESGLDRSLAEVETDYIRSVLASVEGNKTRAAAVLGIDRKTLREKLKHSGTAGN
ncbi:MAG: sigma-54-dependent Fis family transcriptional regulator [Phycisphaerales bacterium]|nr:MAG: sigma-54-dependent Fis family transcriptional regulator [Phycisphaerales bacterium]